MYVCNHLIIFRVLLDLYIWEYFKCYVSLFNLHLGLNHNLLYYKIDFNVKGIVEHSIRCGIMSLIHQKF
jgi:hypothetical protein